MYELKSYVITWYNPQREKLDAPAADSYYLYNRTHTVQGYSDAIRTAKRLADRFGCAILWDERGVIEPEDGWFSVLIRGHQFIRVYGDDPSLDVVRSTFGGE